MIQASEAEWKLVTDLLQSRFGLVYDSVRREYLSARLSARLAALRLRSLAEYYHFLLFHPERAAEEPLFRQAATNSETYFFRERHQLDLLAREVAPKLAPTLAGRPLRVLSAGCSSGEEVYSIAITMSEDGPPGARFAVHGIDLNPLRVEQARAAVYESSSLRACDADARRRYFEPRGPRMVLRPRFRSSVEISEGNILELRSATPYHVIFCRNVLIYFSERALHEAVTRLCASLVPGGFLFVGHAESLIHRRPELEARVIAGTVVYRKPEAPGEAA